MPTPNETEAPALPFPGSREFRAGAHQALLVSNGRDTFFVTEIQRAIAGPDSPLKRFLPPAAYTTGSRSSGTGGAAKVTYAAEGDPAEIKPLRSAAARLPGAVALPKAEIEAFAAAVAQFSAANANLTPMQQQCRREFRLPDPVREPDAYWVSGSGSDRRLLILWGCERFSRTSVPLDRVVEHLKSCEMAWEDKQQLALQLALRREEALSRFLGIPSKDGDGLIILGQPVPAKSLKPFTTFGRDAFQAFDTAAKAFVAKASDEKTNPFEAELRREFRLPSLLNAPARFHRNGGDVAIDVSSVDPLKGVSPAQIGDDYNLENPPLNLQLSKRVKFQGTAKIIAAAAVVAVGLIAGGVFLFGPDREAPRFLELKPVGHSTLSLQFSEEMALPAKDAFAFIEDKAKVSAVRLSSDGKVLFVDTSAPMVDGEDYMIALSDTITDEAGNPLPKTDEKFTFFDSAVPTLVKDGAISAGGMSARDLVLTFTKPIAEDSLSPNAFHIAPLSGGEPGKRIPVAEAKLDPDIKDGTRVIVTADEDFQGRRQYVLSLRGVTDRAKKPNRAEVENVPFEYKDILPPTVRGIAATGATYEVVVEFSKKVESKIALDEMNYTITSPAKEKNGVRLVSGAAKLDESGRFLTLRLERGTLTPGKYHLLVNSAADTQGNKLKQPIGRDFEFADAAQRGSPKIKTIAAEDSSPYLTLEFDRGIASASINAERFRILNNDRSASDFTVAEASPDSDDTRKVRVRLSKNPGSGVLYYVRTEALEDIFGTKQDAPELKDFRASGTGRPQTNLTLSRGPQLLGGGTQVKILFDNIITRDSAENPANYIVSPETPIIQVKYEVENDASGKPATSSATLVFGAAFTNPVSVGAKNLQLEGDAVGMMYRVRSKAAMPAIGQ